MMVSLDYHQVDAGHLRNEFLLSVEHFWKLQRHGEAGNLATGMKPFFPFRWQRTVVEEVLWYQHGSVKVTAQ